jgi:diacylglycerol kinase (ATP)
LNLTLMFNPSSGNGRREAVIERIVAPLRQDGHRVLLLRVNDDSFDPADVRRTLAGSDALLIAGGDGTVNHALPMVLDTGVPIHHIPFGTENLFARQFGMTRDPEAVRRAVASPEVISVDAAECNGRPFAIMCSVGPDADIVHRVAAARTGGISHLSYVLPSLRALFTGAIVPLSLEVDGRVLFQNRRGMLVVANSEQYAVGINPAYGSSISDGALDAVFLPAGSKLLVIAWILASRLRVAHLFPARVHVRGSRVVAVAPEPGFHLQMDGEAVHGPDDAGRTDQLDMKIRPGALRILLPAARRS